MSLHRRCHRPVDWLQSRQGQCWCSELCSAAVARASALSEIGRLRDCLRRWGCRHTGHSRREWGGSCRSCWSEGGRRTLKGRCWRGGCRRDGMPGSHRYAAWNAAHRSGGHAASSESLARRGWNAADARAPRRDWHSRSSWSIGRGRLEGSCRSHRRHARRSWGKALRCARNQIAKTRSTRRSRRHAARQSTWRERHCQARSIRSCSRWRKASA
mmetsp:Transcript_22295/g.49337  ORF Transcript_22295/g.49337 Transcript_22295/m.49337 type:complete len:214 (+) Transcript_22295:190-831(+)